MLRSIVVAGLLVSSVHGQCPATPPGGCSVCGEGLCVGNSEAIFAFPGFPEVACGLLEEAGYTGAVPLDQCGFLAGLIGVCECGTTSSAPPPTEPPVAPTVPPEPPTPRPVAPPPVDIPSPPTPMPVSPPGPATCPEVPAEGCSVCGDDLCVQNPEAIFAFPGFPEVACGLLEQAGYTGAVPLDQCGFLSALIGVCECGVPASPPMTPMPVAPETPPPTPLPPTPSPVSGIPDPTAAPAPPPTPEPLPTGPQPTPFPVLVPTRAPGPVPTRQPLAPAPTPSRKPIFVVTPTPAATGTPKPSKPTTGKKSGMGMMGMMGTGKRRALAGHILARRGHVVGGV